MAAASAFAARLAGVAAIVCLHTYWFLQPTPLALRGLTALLVAVSIARPALGLVAFAGVAPLSTAIANFCGAPGLGGLFLEQMALAIGVGSLLRGGASDGATRIGGPAALVAVVAVASALAVTIGAVLSVVPGSGAGPDVHIAGLVNLQTAYRSTVWAPLFAALIVVAAAVLGWSAERTIRRMPALAIQLVAIALIGHAGAALMNIYTVFNAAMTTGHLFQSLPGLLMSVRLSMQTDVHAAASALLLAGVAGFGLFASARTGTAAAVVVLLGLVAGGLWITGSRVAIVLGIIAAIGAVIWSRVHVGRRRLVLAAITVAAIGAGAWLSTFYPSSRYNAPSASVGSRLILINAGLRMAEQAPVFGIGVTRFYVESAAAAGPDLPRLSGYTHENAHNNFIQVLAEQGLIGLAALLWWLGVVMFGGWRAQVKDHDPRRAALLLGIVACVGTWLTGHPLLVPEFALVFWFFCGILLATTRSATATRTRWPLWTLVAVVLVSVPFRINALRNAADLEHIGVGLSIWQHDDAQRYREAGATFAVYLPATGHPVDVPIRRAPGAPDPLVIDASIRGKHTATLTLQGDGWHVAPIVVPEGSRRFERVDFAARIPSAGYRIPDVLLRVGRAVPH